MPETLGNEYFQGIVPEPVSCLYTQIWNRMEYFRLSEERISHTYVDGRSDHGRVSTDVFDRVVEVMEHTIIPDGVIMNTQEHIRQIKI